MKTESAARLVSLYPARWQARYGDEFAHVLREQRLTFKLAFDVLGGAIDAHITGGGMNQGLLKRCAAGGPKLTVEDTWRATWVMIGSSLTFAGLYILAANLRVADKELIDAFGIMGYPAALIVTMPFYYMKDHSRTAKVALVAGCLAILAGISYLTALI